MAGQCVATHKQHDKFTNTFCSYANKVG